MEYRAQVQGRCQRQRIKEPKPKPLNWRSDIQIWIDEWKERVDQKSPFSKQGLHIVEAQIDWRLISNSGVDEEIIRPVIGAGGWPLIPGSGIKGLFRRACQPERLLRWCGSPCGPGDPKPGILRFHGAWPADVSWTSALLDVAHPQQDWQVGFTRGRKNHSAFGVVSLYQPRLHIGLSCSDPSITAGEWAEIEDTLRRALRAGIGGRTCAGYGSSGRLSGDLLFECALEGQGTAAKLLLKTPEHPNGVPEFRPTMFRAAIRGMALRLFGGLTDASTALEVVGRIFGSIGPGEDQNVGLLATAYTDASFQLGRYGWEGWKQPIFSTSGALQWRLTRKPRTQESAELLQELLAALHGLTMSLGGFGRGWRRPDHRIFKPRYDKTPIGCHWEWRNVDTLPGFIRIRTSSDLAALLRRSRHLAERWLRATGAPVGSFAPWQEVIHPEKMLVWTRCAINTQDAEVIHWFHNPRQGEPVRDPRDLRKSDLAGKMNQVGRIWNRLLALEMTTQVAPVMKALANPTSRPSSAMARHATVMARPESGALSRPFNTKQDIAQGGEVWMNYATGPFLESLVLFPEKQQSPDFIKVMDGGANVGFKRVQFDT